MEGLKFAPPPPLQTTDVITATSSPKVALLFLQQSGPGAEVWQVRSSMTEGLFIGIFQSLE